jgi:restriction system protein
MLAAVVSSPLEFGILISSQLVIELKRGMSSDDAVGQVLRYIGWVRENIAKPNQKVEGVIVCSEVDDALKYAVREPEHVSVMKYRVSFSLTEPEL